MLRRMKKLYANALLGVQATGNSNAIRRAWEPLRMASLAARMMLVSAAAKRWNVDAASWRAGEGEVFQREESHVWRTCRRRSTPPPSPRTWR
jgi:CO/xanthine dehydrogenase Mo-binding subunit